MTEFDPTPPEAGTEPETQEQRATRALTAIFSGGDLAAETLRLSNEFTDRKTSWLKAAVGRRDAGR